MILIETWEIDVPRCILIYGTAPCQAVLGVTGAEKCFQAPESCQDVENFSSETQTVRIETSSEGFSYIEDGIVSFPVLQNVKINPQDIKSGEDLGKRERISIVAQNGPDDDSFFDKYVDERDYNPYERGTLFGKFHARYPNVKGYPCRYYYGDASVPLSERIVRHYIAHSSQLIDGGENYEMEAKDALDLIEGKKYLFPEPSNALLAEDIGTGLTPFDLKPVGIGADLPASGKAAIEKEVISYTLSGDTITPTARALDTSELKAHNEDSTFQPVGVLSGTASDILNTLVQNVDGLTDYNNKAAWDSELVTANRTNNYHGEVGEPTEYHKLIGELMRDVGLDIHTDVEEKKIAMFVIRKKPAVFSASVDNTFNIQPETDSSNRISAAYIQYGRINPLEKMDEGQNYAGKLLNVDPDPKMQIMENSPNIRTHNSRFIPITGRVFAESLSFLMIGRYHKPLKTVMAFFPWDDAPKLGEVGQAQSRFYEDLTGRSNQFFPVQVTSSQPQQGKILITMKQYNVDSDQNNDPNLREVPIDVDVFNINLREWYNDTYTDAPPTNSTVRFITSPGIIIGSEIRDQFSVVAGSWPEVAADNVIIELVELVIRGRGGDGAIPGFDGNPGSPALFTNVAMTAIDCEFSGGGGGGAGETVTIASNIYNATGGGGAGVEPGIGYEDGTETEGGAGENNDENAIGGDGGDLGQTGGNSSTGNTGGAPGNAVDGFSLLTLSNTTINGPTVN